MKKRTLLASVLLLLCVAMVAQATSWGALADYDLEANNGQPRGQKYLLRKVLDEGQVAVQLILPPELEQKRTPYEKTITTLYRKWFLLPAQLITEQKREEEFADILPLLKETFTVNFVQEENEADIVFRITDLEFIQKKCEGAPACYLHPDGKDRKLPEILLPPENLLRKMESRGRFTASVMGLHEIGHSLGLSDQYASAADRNTHVIYSSVDRSKDSMMNTSLKMTCDDADGIINLIDITLNAQSERNEWGWRSLCPQSKEVYSYGQSAERGTYYVVLGNFEKGMKMLSYDKGTSSGNFFPWSSAVKKPWLWAQKIQETPLEYDGRNRPVLAQGDHNETIYYSYTYNKQVKLVVINGQAVYVEILSPSYLRQPMSRYVKFNTYSFIARPDNEEIFVEARFSDKKGGEIFYSTEGDGYLNLRFDKKKKVVDEYGSGKFAIFSQDIGGVAGFGTAGPVESKFDKAIAEEEVKNTREELIRWFVQHYQ